MGQMGQVGQDIRRGTQCEPGTRPTAGSSGAWIDDQSRAQELEHVGPPAYQ
jgi:hypothetical protein